MSLNGRAKSGCQVTQFIYIRDNLTLPFHFVTFFNGAELLRESSQHSVSTSKNKTRDSGMNRDTSE